MANPTKKDNNSIMNFDGLALRCDQVIIDDAVVLGGSQGAHIADVAAPAAYTAATISGTYSQSEVQAVADALEALRDEVATLTTAHNAVLARLEDAGISADA